MNSVSRQFQQASYGLAIQLEGIIGGQTHNPVGLAFLDDGGEPREYVVSGTAVDAQADCRPQAAVRSSAASVVVASQCSATGAERTLSASTCSKGIPRTG